MVAVSYFFVIGNAGPVQKKIPSQDLQNDLKSKRIGLDC